MNCYNKSRYITLHVGDILGTANCVSCKEDIISFYNKMLDLIKKVFKIQRVVQIEQSCELIVSKFGTDFLIIDECSSKEIASVLRNAWLHIDSEYEIIKKYKRCLGTAYCILNTNEFLLGYDTFNKAFNIYSYSKCIDLKEKMPIEMNILNIAPFQVVDRLMEWNFLEHIKSGIVLHGFTSTDIERMGVKLDRAFREKIFPSRFVYFCEKRRVYLNDLYIKFEKDGCICNCHINESPAYQLMLGNHEKYDKLLDIEEKEYYGKLKLENHSKTGFIDLCKAMEKQYDERYKIIIWPDYWIYDGHHRASFLCWKFGPYFQTETLILYSILLFPFDKVPYNSKIVIYGFGYVGRIYARQIRLTAYACIVCVIDRNADKMKSCASEYNINIVNAKHFFNNNYDFDYLVIAIKNPKDAYGIKTCLKEHGVTEDKIVPKDYFFCLGI